jgi:LacI family transcriptional regulator
MERRNSLQNLSAFIFTGFAYTKGGADAVTKLTIKDIAREAGVSTATISRVMNNSGYVKSAVKHHVLSVIERCNYQPNAIARSLKQDKSRAVGIVLPDMSNSYFMKIARSIQHRCFEKGYHLLFIDTEEDARKEKEALDFLQEKRIEALILAGTGSNLRQIQAMSDEGIRVILVDRRFDLPLDTIAEDNFYPTKAAIEYLLGRKHNRIAVVNGPQTIVTARERQQGALVAFGEAGLALAPELIFEGDYTCKSGLTAIRRFMELDEPPSAVFSANNEMTFGIFLGLREMGLALDCIEIVSFGELDFSSLFQHKLSVIMQNPERIGEFVGDLIVKRLGEATTEAENHIFIPKLIPYESS